jgi:hypothetical protein
MYNMRKYDIIFDVSRYLLLGSASKKAQATSKLWGIQVALKTEKISYTKKFYFDINWTGTPLFLFQLEGKEATAKVIEKVPGVDRDREWGLFIPSEKIWLKQNRKFSEYPQLATEKVSFPSFQGHLTV